MSAEFNKILCAILSAILVLLLSSFIGDLIYHPEKGNKKLSYKIEEDITEDSQQEISEVKNEETISKQDIENLLVKADLEKGKKFATKNCGACHSFILPIKNKIGPSLAMLLNRKVASIDGFKYSKSFLAIDKNWSYENLFFFLKNPKSWAPGTKMSYRGISKEDDLINVLKYLSHVSKLNES